LSASVEVTPENKVTIRMAREEDLAGIHVIYNEQVLHGTASFDTEPRTPEAQLEWFRKWPSDRYPIIVAERQVRIVGWGRLSPWSDRKAYNRTVENSVYVHRDCRGQGIGKLVLRELIVMARAARLGVIVARIAQGNPESLALHKAHGFEEIGVMRRVGEKFGRLLDVHMLELHLVEPETPESP
jgi:phosphinothricin acetyltransferase